MAYDIKPDITLRSPAELLSAVPYLMGYQPRDRVVLVGLDGQGIQVVSAAGLPEPDQPVSEVAIAETVFRHHRLDAAIIVGYGPQEPVTRCVEHLRAVCDAAGVEVVEAMRVTDGYYWSYVCQNAQCCPPEGAPLAEPHSAVDAAFTVNGVQALPDRESIGARLEPVRGTQRGRVTRATRRLAERLVDPASVIPPQQHLRANGRTILTRLTSQGEIPPLPDAVLLACALGDRRWADRALAIEAMIDIDQYGPQRGLDAWVWLTRHVDHKHRAVPAALLGYAAWRAGNGVLAAAAVKRALSDDPESGLAAMLRRILDDAVPPSAVPKLRRTGLDTTELAAAEESLAGCGTQSTSRSSPQ